ncbi:MAG: AAA family ATPase [Anaerolineae bacterium]|nr:AAA family ATPase [Anaerolineae bacterium]
MSVFQESPNHLTIEALKEAYERLRRFAPLEATPLLDFMLFRRRLHEFNALGGPTADQYVLYDLLAEVLTQQLTTLRQSYHDLPFDPLASRAEVLDMLAQDGQYANEFLIGCSALYCRYVRADLDFAWEEIAQALAQHPRTLLRYVDSTWQLLLHTFYRLEHQACERELQQRLWMALPQQTFVQLEDQQALIRSAFHALTTTSTALAIYGPPGSGKSTIAAQLGSALIDQSRVQAVAWLDLPSRLEVSSGDLAEILADAICQQLHLPTQGSRSAEEVLYNHLNYLIGKGYQLLLILDGIDGWQAALRHLWPFMSHCLVIITSRTLPKGWAGFEFYCAPLDTADALTLLTFLDRRSGWRERAMDEAVCQRLTQIAGGNPAKLRRAYHVWFNIMRETAYTG